MAEANTVATPYTSNQGVSQDQLKALATEIQKGYTDLPSMKTQIVNQVANEEGMLAPLQEQRGNMIQKLFEHDKNYQQTYGQTTSPTFIENPMARSAGQDASSAPIWNALSNLGGNIATRRTMLGNAVANAVDARKAELEGMSARLNALLRLYESDAANAGKKLTQVDAGDRIELYDQDNKLFATVKKGTLGGAPLDQLTETTPGKTTTTTNTEAPAEKTLTPEERAEADYPSMTDAEKKAFLDAKTMNGKVLTAQQMSDYEKLMKGQPTSTPTDLSGSIGKTTITPGQFTGGQQTGLGIGTPTNALGTLGIKL